MFSCQQFLDYDYVSSCLAADATGPFSFLLMLQLSLSVFANAATACFSFLFLLVAFSFVAAAGSCYSFIHSFIHTDHLYSASSRELLRGAPDSSTAKKSSLKLRKQRR